MSIDDALIYLGTALGAAAMGAAGALGARARGRREEPGPSPVADSPSGTYQVPAAEVPAARSGAWNAAPLPDPAAMLKPLDQLIESATTRALEPLRIEVREARTDINDLRAELRTMRADHEHRIRAVEINQARTRKDTPPR